MKYVSSFVSLLNYFALWSPHENFQVYSLYFFHKGAVMPVKSFQVKVDHFFSLSLPNINFLLSTKVVLPYFIYFLIQILFV